jgi:hypothetical protein
MLARAAAPLTMALCALGLPARHAGAQPPDFSGLYFPYRGRSSEHLWMKFPTLHWDDSRRVP